MSAWSFRGTGAAGELRRWHGSLEEHRGDRALLRRAATPGEVALVPGYHRLVAALGGPEGRSDDDLRALAAAAGLIACTPGDRPGQHVAREMAAARPGGGPLVHETRFRRLLRCPDRETLYPQLARLLRLLDRPVDLVDLAESVSRWNDQARRRWAYDYFATANPKS